MAFACSTGLFQHEGSPPSAEPNLEQLLQKRILSSAVQSVIPLASQAGYICDTLRTDSLSLRLRVNWNCAGRSCRNKVERPSSLQTLGTHRILVDLIERGFCSASAFALPAWVRMLDLETPFRTALQTAKDGIGNLKAKIIVVVLTAYKLCNWVVTNLRSDKSGLLKGSKVSLRAHLTVTRGNQRPSSFYGYRNTMTQHLTVKFIGVIAQNVPLEWHPRLPFVSCCGAGALWSPRAPAS